MSKRVRTLLSFLLGMSLFGCGSFNSYQFPPAVVLVGPPTGTPNQPVTIPSDCFYHPPDTESIPRLPLEELEKIDKNDDIALDAIQQSYIKELRAYIKRLQQTYRGSYQDYIKRCVPTAKNTG